VFGDMIGLLLIAAIFAGGFALGYWCRAMISKHRRKRFATK
jgi:hypothetical protein